MFSGGVSREKSLSELDGKLGCRQLPSYWWIFPLLSDVAYRQINQLGRRFIAGKVPSGFEHLAQLHVQTLNGVGGVNDFADLSPIGEERDHLFPDSSPALHDRGEFFAPLAIGNLLQPFSRQF